MEKVLFGLLLSLLPFLVVTFISIHGLVSLQAKRYPTQWALDGKPELLGDVQNQFILHFKLLSWLFKTPLWIRDDPQAAALLKRIRVCAAIWNIGMLICFYLGYKIFSQL